MIDNGISACFAAWKAGLLVLVMVGGTALADCPDVDPQAVAWLDKMTESGQQLSYRGVVTLQRSGELQAVEMTRQVGPEGVSDRLVQLTGQGAVVERANQPLDCVQTGCQLRRLQRDLAAGQCGISEYYRLSMMGTERVAGRKAVRVRLEPRDMFRFGYVMVVDEATGLLLKTETTSGARVLEKFQFASIEIGEEFLSGAAEERPAPVVVRAGEDIDGRVRGAPTDSEWQPEWVPPGFVATENGLGVSGRKTYTDGLSVFSVFLEEGRELRAGQGLVRYGCTTSYSLGAELGGQPVLVTVIGEVPPNTARMVAASVNWVK
ncbi:MAG: MucB/RseB C-terminal domain-containing protein [Pseudomonadota bacterium]